ncbi:MAG: NUDIX domain-containing protein [Candidatus Aenigmarchaeota archaeon]|nr:NUDIX domain-containing protein [Candidatus Aenigmarchaeota archaeon]
MIEIAGCAIIKDGKLLLLWKKKHSHYELPGGKIEPGETPEQAAVREANEEIVCTVQILQYGGYDDVSYQDKELRGHIFLAKIIEGEPNIMEPEIFGEMIWLPVNMLGKHKLAKNLRQFCIRYFENSDKPY